MTKEKFLKQAREAMEDWFNFCLYVGFSCSLDLQRLSLARGCVRRGSFQANLARQRVLRALGLARDRGQEHSGLVGEALQGKRFA